MVNVSVPGVRAPAAGFDDPFGVLDACHERVRRSLALLERLAEHLGASGVDGAARDAARDVLRYFDLAAPAHHEDEERHVVPALRASGDAVAIASAERLLQDHVRIRAAWARLAPMLVRVANGSDPGRAAFGATAAEFVALHGPHLALEDGLAFPRASALIGVQGEPALRAMGAEMAGRRGVRVESAQEVADRAI